MYRINGLDPDRLEVEHPQIYSEGATDEMSVRLSEEEDKYGGRLRWMGEYPDVDTCRKFGLWCYMGPSGWTSCSSDHPGATEDLNRLHRIARWDKNFRCWILNAN